MSQSLQYKVAPLGEVQRLSIEAEFARLLDEAGNERNSIDLTQVDDARYSELKYRGIVIRKVDLRAGDTLFSLGLNDVSGRTPAEPPLSNFYACAAKLLAALAGVQPDFEMEIGENRKMRIFWFSLGIFALVIPPAILVGALATGVSWSKLSDGWMPFFALLAFGSLLVYSNRPWEPLMRVPVVTLAEAMARPGKDAIGEPESDPPH